MAAPRLMFFWGPGPATKEVVHVVKWISVTSCPVRNVQFSQSDSLNRSKLFKHYGLVSEVELVQRSTLKAREGQIIYIPS
jgi:hypothetical protein